jgi:hypothetical protein
MKRFLLVWVCLAVVMLVGTALLSLLVFKRIDLRLVALVELLVVPTLQAVVLLWASGEWSFTRLPRLAREAHGHAAVLGFLAFDAVVVALGWAFYSRSLLGVAAVGSLQPAWTGVKTAGVALVAGTLAARGLRRLADRLWLGIVALAALAFAAEPFRPWLGGLATHVLPPALPTVLRWLVVYGGLFVLVMAALVHTGTVLRAGSALGAAFIDAALAVAFIAGLVTVPSIFLKPYLVEPGAAIVRTCVSLAATFTLAGLLAACTIRVPAADPTT